MQCCKLMISSWSSLSCTCAVSDTMEVGKMWGDRTEEGTSTDIQDVTLWSSLCSFYLGQMKIAEQRFLKTVWYKITFHRRLFETRSLGYLLKQKLYLGVAQESQFHSITLDRFRTSVKIIQCMTKGKPPLAWKRNWEILKPVWKII